MNTIELPNDVAARTTRELQTQLYDLRNLTAYADSRALINLLDRDQPACHIGRYFDDMARQHRRDAAPIERELDRRGWE